MTIRKAQPKGPTVPPNALTKELERLQRVSKTKPGKLRKEKKKNKGSLLEKHMTQEKDPKKAQQQRGQA